MMEEAGVAFREDFWLLVLHPLHPFLQTFKAFVFIA